MYRILISILFIFIYLAGIGQHLSLTSQREIDSLTRLLPFSEEKERVDIMNNLASFYAPVNFDSSIYYSAQAMRIATNNGFPYGVGCSRLYTGNAYYYKMDFKNALISYLSARTILEEGAHYNELGELCLMLGHINFFIRRSEKSFSYYRNALHHYQAIGDETSEAQVYEAMSLAMDNLGYEPKDSALIYGQKLLNYARKVNDTYREAFALLIIGQIYLSNNESYLIKQKALSYNDSALVLAMKFNYEELIAIIYLNTGCYYDKSTPLFEFTLNMPLSRSYFNKSLTAARKIKSSYLQAMILLSLAEIDIEEKKYDQADNHLQQCEARLNDYFRIEWQINSLAKIEYSFSKIIDYYLAQRTLNDMYHARYRLALATGRFEKAIDYLEHSYQSRDATNASQQGRQLELLMAESDAEKTDQKIKALAQENELNQLKLTQNRFIFGGVAAVVVIISLFMLLYFQRKRMKAEQKSILNEQRLLRAQMNPHFLFNSLASIQNYIINEETDKASIYLSRFSQLVRNILDNSVEEYVPVEKEIETVRNYLELQKVRYAGKFDYSIDIDADIDTEIVMIPPMLAQPFIENAIEHGIRHRAMSGHIDIRFRLEDNLIRFEVEDDGVGREKAKEIEIKQGIKHRSMATSITIDRLAAINKKLKKKIRMEIEDLKDQDGVGIGTKVRFGIPAVVK